MKGLIIGPHPQWSQVTPAAGLSIVCRFESAVTDELAVRMQPEPTSVSAFKFICHRADQLMQNREMQILN